MQANTNEYISVNNNQTIPLDSIPLMEYEQFRELNLALISESVSRHCVSYFGYYLNESAGGFVSETPNAETVKLICCIADDDQHTIFVSSSVINPRETLESLTALNHNFENFERELHENFGLYYPDHPWLKPLRYSHNRYDKSKTIANHPFLRGSGDELHEVGVGPIHAGVIEPGHFRFICNGEQILHLEIQLGFQHRGIEELFVKKKKLIERAILAENIAGDTTSGHATAFAGIWESLCGYKASRSLDTARTLALELERIAIHTGDLAAICTDVAYQLGNSVYGRLRTPIVNFMQEWCGNRLGKGLTRPGYSNYPFTAELADRLKTILDTYESDYNEMTDKMFKLPSALSRFEKTGVVTYDQVREIGTVGMAAKMSGLAKDVRKSHPHALYKELSHEPVVKHHGDVYSRVQIRAEEISQSIGYIRQLLKSLPEEPVPDAKTIHSLIPAVNSFTISLVEGWRGEICHCAVTDNSGELVIYKIKDPSFHNWMALAQSVRNNEISDFPICNKSFNLSYCGFDL